MADADVPLILLVDRNTASAAEVFTAALQENGRALVVGEKTYGKGLVQTIARLQDGSALVVTVARYETPLGRDINRYSVYLFYWYKSTNTDAEFIQGWHPTRLCRQMRSLAGLRMRSSISFWESLIPQRG